MTGKKQSILLLNQTFYPDKAATAQHLTDLAFELEADGHEVTVLTGRRGYADPSQVYPAQELRQGIKIIRVWPHSWGKKIRVLRIAEAVFINLAFAFKLFSLPRFDKIVCLTSPPLIAAAAAACASLKKTKLVYWVMDLNPDEAIAAGWVKEGSFSARALGKALEFSLHKSDLIIALDEYMSQRIQHKGIGVGRIRVIPPWPLDTDLDYIPQEKNPFLVEHHLQKKFVVMYSGNFSICHPLITLLNSALALKNDPDIVFLFIGGGARLDEVLEFKSNYGLDNIVYLPYVPRHHIKFSLSAANLHVVVMGEPYVGIVHPCKIYSILRLGIPFLYIGPEKSHVGDILKGGYPGYGARHGDVGKIAGLITELKTRTSVRSQSAHARHLEFSRANLLTKLKHEIAIV